MDARGKAKVKTPVGRGHVKVPVNSSANQDVSNDDCCSICFDDMRGGKRRVLRSSGYLEVLDCGHFFCPPCISTYASTAIADGETSNGK